MMIKTKRKVIKKSIFERNELIRMYIFDFLMAFLLTRTDFWGVTIPLGVSYGLARSFGGVTLYSVVGAFLGYIFMPNTVEGFLYAGILLVCVAFFNLTKANKFTIIFATFTVLGGISVLTRGLSFEDFVNFFAVNVACLSSYYIFSKLNDNKYEEVAKLFLIVTMAMATIEFKVYELSPVRIVLVLVILSVIYYVDASKSAIIAVLFGAVADILSKTMIFTIGYSFASVLVGTTKIVNKAMFSSAFCVLFILFSGFSQGEEVFFVAVYEVAIACVIFVALPRKFFRYFLNKKQVVSVKQLTTTGILQDISEILIDTERTKKGMDFKDIKHIFNLTEDKVCKTCYFNSRCYGKEYQNTIDAYNVAAIKICETASATSRDFPEYFSKQCINFTNFLYSLNQGISVIKEKKQTKSELFVQKQMMAEQYKALADVLQKAEAEFADRYYPKFDSEIFEYLKSYKMLSKVVVYTNLSGLFFVDIAVLKGDRILSNREDIARNISRILNKKIEFGSQSIENKHARFIFKEKVPYSANVIVKNTSKEKISGDSVSYFTTDEDVFYSMLADGMGSGEIANYESTSIIKLLIKLLKSRTTPLKATKVIEPLSKIKSEGDVFVALDLLAVNLITLETQFVKYGAFESYIINDYELKKVECNNLALGLDTQAEITRFKLNPNDKILMLSDGFSLTQDEIKQMFYENPYDICENLFKADCSANDDKTVVFIELNNSR